MLVCCVVVAERQSVAVGGTAIDGMDVCMRVCVCVYVDVYVLYVWGAKVHW
jgi:hypothetical protein